MVMHSPSVKAVGRRRLPLGCGRCAGYTQPDGLCFPGLRFERCHMPTSSVVYLALGTRRITAATRQTAAAAEGGSTVLLVVPDSPAWQAAEPAPDVTVRHVTGTGRRAAAAARRLLLGPDGPDPDMPVLLVARDPGALPVAWAVGRRRPARRVVTDVAAGSGRRPAPADLAVVTPWYPSPNDDFAGAL